MRLHLTNIHGLGAGKLVESLLPPLLAELKHDKIHVYISEYQKLDMLIQEDKINVSFYKRFLPNNISRFLEVMFFYRIFYGQGPILVMGDLPLRGINQQTVFVHTPFLVSKNIRMPFIVKIKYIIMKAVFRMNAKFVDQFIVQTESMASALSLQYNVPIEKIFIVLQPAFPWIVKKRNSKRTLHKKCPKGLTLFYPASHYWHKNHKLFSRVPMHQIEKLPIRKIIFTIEEKYNPSPGVKFIDCVGELNHGMMNKYYGEADALLFLSKAESYGFPLVEAMSLGLPIVCPNLPYAREICGDEAIYFEISDPNSLCHALSSLHDKLEHGWMPDWSQQLAHIPKDWRDVARSILSIAIASKSENDDHKI